MSLTRGHAATKTHSPTAAVPLQRELHQNDTRKASHLAQRGAAARKALPVNRSLHVNKGQRHEFGDAALRGGIRAARTRSDSKNQADGKRHCSGHLFRAVSPQVLLRFTFKHAR